LLRDITQRAYSHKGGPLRRLAALGGAGAYSSTAEDLTRFIQTSVVEDEPASQLLLKMSEKQYDGDTGIGWSNPRLSITSLVTGV
jgi:hypothetical protein